MCQPRWILSALGVALAVSACTIQHRVSATPARLAGVFKVSLRDGRKVVAVASPTAEGVVWEPVGGSGRITDAEIASFERTRRATGALIGLGVGVTIGAVTGGYFGFTSEKRGHCGLFGCTVYTRGEETVFEGVTWGLLGGAVGAILGGIGGLTNRYIIRHDSSIQVSARPTAGGAAATLSWSF